MEDNKFPPHFVAEGEEIKGDTSPVTMVIVAFEDGRQLTYVGKDAHIFCAHFVNGVAISEHTGIPKPNALEWGGSGKLVQ